MYILMHTYTPINFYTHVYIVDIIMFSCAASIATVVVATMPPIAAPNAPT